MEQNIKAIIEAVLSRLKEEQHTGPLSQPQTERPPALPFSREDIPAEISARHVHLSKEDLLELTGLTELASSRAISQPGQYLSDQRVTLIGPKGSISNVAVLGPLRSRTQAEISATDARQLGIAAPVRLSGDLKDAVSVHIQLGDNIICRKAAIVAKRHLHATPQDAERLGFKDGQSLAVRLRGSRPLILEGVVARVSPKAALALHIDTDEANAAGLAPGAFCRLAAVEAARDDAPQPSPDAPVSDGAPSLPGRLITEEHVKQLNREGARMLRLMPGQLITPLARDTLKDCGITLEE